MGAWCGCVILVRLFSLLDAVMISPFAQLHHYLVEHRAMTL